MRALLVVSLAACVEHGQQPPMIDADCVGIAQLDGAVGDRRTFQGISNGDVCMQLDTRNNVRSGHFSATSGSTQGLDSPFSLVLVDEGGTLLATGADITIGEEFPSTLASLEHGLPTGFLIDVILQVRCDAGCDDTTQIAVSLFEPLD
jgi:hypothetical protein